MSQHNSYPMQNRGVSPHQNSRNGFGATHEEILIPGGHVPQYTTPISSEETTRRPLLIPNILPPEPSRKHFSSWFYYPYFTYFITLVEVGVFIYQLFNMHQLTGSYIQTDPINYMIGPSPEALIHQGGKFVPCMKPIPGFKNQLKCPSSTATSVACSLSELCGFGALSQQAAEQNPDQWFRFITPIFLHGGVLHLIFNMMGQVSLGAQLERTYGPIRIGIIYLAAGVSGVLLGSNLATDNIVSVGASGAIFGLIACDLVELLVNWNYLVSPFCELIKVIFCIGLYFAIGLIPWIDNFAHIGGFVGGILASGMVIPSYRDRNRKRSYTFAFLGILSLVSGVLLIIWLYFSINGFYHGNWAASCPNCKYLNCLPATGLC